MGITLVWNIIFVSALSLGFFLATVLFIQYFKQRQLSQLFLGGFVFVFSTILLNNFVYWHQAMETYPHFIYSSFSSRFLLAPLFYFYCKTFLSSTFNKIDVLHILPFLGLTALCLPFYILSAAEKLTYASSFSEAPSVFWLYFIASIKWWLSLQLLAYPCWIYYQLSQHLKQSTKLHKAKSNQINYLYFFNSLILLYGLMMFLYYILVTFNIGGIEKDYYISLVLCMAVYGISYIGMDNPDLLKGEQFLQKLSTLKYNKTKLEAAYLENTITQLKQVMETEKIYLASDIKLQQVAEKIDIPRHHISQALNQHLGKTFHEFINQYRIEYACQLLQMPRPNLSIKTVMYESGFNNRASFNNNFKKFKGMTASQYLNKNQLSDASNT